MIPATEARLFPDLNFTDPSSALHFEGVPNGPVSEFSGYTVTKITGWNEGLDVRRETVNWANAIGTVALPGTLDARVVSIEGFVVARTAQELETLRRRLTGVLSHGRLGRLQVSSGGREMWGYVASGGATSFTDETYNRHRAYARYKITLYQADPRKYGEVRTYGPAGSVDVSHEGNYDSHPLVRVRCTSAMPTGYALYGPAGERYRIDRPMTVGQVHDVDMKTGRILVGGSLVLGAVESGSPWSIPPFKQSNVYLHAATGAGTIEVRVTDTDV